MAGGVRAQKFELQFIAFQTTVVDHFMGSFQLSVFIFFYFILFYFGQNKILYVSHNNKATTDEKQQANALHKSGRLYK